MSNDDYCVCCENCFSTIAKTSVREAKLWMGLCRLSAIHKAYLAVRTDFEEFRSLELKGYITTTDVDELTVIRVNGHYFVDEEDIFCIKQCKHKEEDD